MANTTKEGKPVVGPRRTELLKLPCQFDGTGVDF
jgi:hypothetical protein